MAPLSGSRATLSGTAGTGILQAQRKVDMKEQILLLEPSAAPLTVLASRLGSSPTVNPQYSWVEDQLYNRYDSTTTTGASATALTVTDATRFRPNDLVLVTRTGEILKTVTGVGTTLTVATRGTINAAVALTSGDELLNIGSSQMEGSSAPTPVSENPVQVSNYTQIIRTPWSSTQTLLHSDQFTRPHDWDHQAAKHGIEHQKDWELTYWHGRPSELTSTANPARTTGGAFYYIASNVTAVGGTLTEATFFGALATAFRYGSDTKVLFASRTMVAAMNGFPRGKIQVTQADQDTTYGLNVMRYVSPFGTLNVVTANLFEGTGYGGVGAILDMSQVKRRVLANENGSRDTHINENIQSPDLDGRTDEYLTESGLEFGLEKKHAKFTGITG